MRPAIILALALGSAGCSPVFHRAEIKAACGTAPMDLMGWRSPKMARVMMDKMKPGDLKQMEAHAFQRSICLKKHAREDLKASQNEGFPGGLWRGFRAKAYAEAAEAATVEWNAFSDAQKKPAPVGDET